MSEIPKPPKGRIEYDFCMVPCRLTARQSGDIYILTKYSVGRQPEQIAESATWEEIYRRGREEQAELRGGRP